MKVILLEQLKKLGKLGDVVNVKGGYARNFLLPKGKALPATKDNLVYLENYKSELEAKEAATRSEAESRKEDLESQGVSITAMVGEGGKLFGSIGTRDIAEAVNKLGKKLTKSEVKLPNGVIRQTGDYEVKIQLHADIAATLQLSVVADQ